MLLPAKPRARAAASGSTTCARTPPAGPRARAAPGAHVRRRARRLAVRQPVHGRAHGGRRQLQVGECFGGVWRVCVEGVEGLEGVRMEGAGSLWHTVWASVGVPSPHPGLASRGGRAGGECPPANQPGPGACSQRAHLAVPAPQPSSGAAQPMRSPTHPQCTPHPTTRALSRAKHHASGPAGPAQPPAALALNPTRHPLPARVRSGRTWVLVSTDLIGRGMDFVGVNTVVNYDFPSTTTDYIHRVGRTGRAGHTGGWRTGCGGAWGRRALCRELEPCCRPI